MADFLSRESELLGDEFATAPTSAIGDSNDFDFDRAAAAFPDINLDGDDVPLPTATPSVFNATTPGAGRLGGDDFNFGSPPRERHTDVKVTGDDEIERFEDQFPDIGVTPEPLPVPTGPTFGATPTFAPRPQPSAFNQTPILTQPIQDEDEPEVIKEWRERQAEEIRARDERSKQKKQETIARAEQSIDQFYEEYNQKKERTIRENKEEETEYLAKLSDSLGEGTTWSRIADLVDLQNSQSKTLARTGAGTTDLTRFKEVLLRLKREGESAPGAAGY